MIGAHAESDEVRVTNYRDFSLHQGVGFCSSSSDRVMWDGTVQELPDKTPIDCWRECKLHFPHSRMLLPEYASTETETWCVCKSDCRCMEDVGNANTLVPSSYRGELPPACSSMPADEAATPARSLSMYSSANDLGDNTSENGTANASTANTTAAPCSDMDTTTDFYSDTCADYTIHPEWCGMGDDDDFTSTVLCCACGGGTTYVPTPPPAPQAGCVSIPAWIAENLNADLCQGDHH